MVVKLFFFFQAEDGIRDYKVTGVQTCALPISAYTPVTFCVSARWRPKTFSSASETSPTVARRRTADRKSTRLNSSHLVISYAVFCLKKKKKTETASIYREYELMYRDSLM